MTPEFILFVAVFLLSYQFGMRYVLTYRFTDTRVRAVLFRAVPVSSTRYDLIKEVRIISPLEALFRPAVRTENRLIGPYVLISRRGFPVLMTPDDPEAFVRRVEASRLRADGSGRLTGALRGL
ncbi:MAG: hypothetical protein M3397_02655 [Actinomycetota bacterium]|jgi:hypothetical protein|nr:hypothetical protein [Actinomycetota bacterium]